MADDSFGAEADVFVEEEVKIDPATLAPDLLMACKLRDDESAVALLEQKVPPCLSEGDSGWTSLHWAARHGSVEVVEALLAAGAAEHYLVAKRRALRFSRKQVKKKKKGFIEDEDEETAVEERRGKYLQIRNPQGGLLSSRVLILNSPLHWAAFHGHLRVVWLLLVAGYDAEDKDEVGNTALHLAAAGGHLAVARALLNEGYSQTPNAFSNRAADVATKQSVLDLLNQKQKHHKRHAANVAFYQEVASELTAAMKVVSTELDSITKLQEQASRLTAALTKARSEAVAASLLASGDLASRRLATNIALREQLEMVRRASPILTQNAYTTLVNKLSRLRREAAELDEKGLSTLLATADALIARSDAEYWLKRHCAPLDAKPCADLECARPMQRLDSAIEAAELRKADAPLMEHARKLLGRFKAELEVRNAIDGVPKVKLPVPDPVPSDYWGPDDSGSVKEDVPEDYVWEPSKSLQALRQASNRLEKALLDSQTANAYPTLIDLAVAAQKTVSDNLKQLERKDEEDKEVAIAAVEKAAKKLKKNNKKKPPPAK